MKLLLILLVTASTLLADWTAVATIATGQKIEVSLRDGSTSQGTFVSASIESLIVKESSAQRTLAKTQIRQVRVYDPGRRIRRGLIWMAVGAGTGAGASAVACLSCANEDHSTYTGVGAAYAQAQPWALWASWPLPGKPYTNNHSQPTPPILSRHWKKR